MSFKRNKNDLDSDKIFCKSIANSISEIIRFSLDEEFRKSIFDLFNVVSSKEVEMEVFKKLFLITQQQNPKEVFNSMENVLEKGINDTKEKNVLTDGKKTKFISNINECNPKSSLKATYSNYNILHKCQILSEKVEEKMEKKRKYYFSQPLLNTTEDNEDFTFQNHNVHQVNSSYTYNNFPLKISITQENEDSLLKNVNENHVYYKFKFKETFKDNVDKYFRKNLKTKKHLSQ